MKEIERIIEDFRKRFVYKGGGRWNYIPDLKHKMHELQLDPSVIEYFIRTAIEQYVIKAKIKELGNLCVCEDIINSKTEAYLHERIAELKKGLKK